MKPLAIAAGSLLVTGVILWLVLTLGAWGFSHRRQSFHEGRLQRLVDREPQLEQVIQGLEAEGTPLVASPQSAEELRQLGLSWDEGTISEILSKGTRWAQTRVFAAGDMVYVLYFDQRGVLRDFSCLGR